MCNEGNKCAEIFKSLERTKIGMAQEQVPQGILSNFRINTYYKLFIYLGSVILILSFFFDVKNYDVSRLRYQAAVVIVAGLICWMWDTFKIFYAAISDTGRYRSEEDEKRIAMDILTGYWVLVGITLLIAVAAFFH